MAQSSQRFEPPQKPGRFNSRANDLASAFVASARSLGASRDALRRSEQRLSAVLETASSGIVVTDEAFRVLVFNAAAEGIFERSRNEMAGQDVGVLFAPRTCARLKQAALAPQEPPSARKPMPCVGLRHDGRTFAAEALLTRFTDTEGARFFALIVGDGTDRMRAQHDLRTARDLLRHVNEDFQRTLLTEMAAQLAAIARELHDDVGSSLAGVSLMVAAAQSECNGKPHAADLLASVQEQVQKSASKVRQLSRGIMPAGDEAGALVPALERLASEMAAAAGTDCTFLARGNFDAVTPATSGHLYRVVQEALANAARHGQATHVHVMLARAGERCRLTVADDGTGCDLARLPVSQAGIGLRSIRARASAIGGTAAVSGTAGRGCRIRVSWTQASARP